MNVSAKLGRLAPVQAVSAALNSQDIDGWVVGGTVRDLLLKRQVDDIDVVVSSAAEPVAKHTAREVSGDVFSLSDKFGTWRVIGPGREWQLDISPVREGDIEADLKQRDFTVNAIAVPVDGGEAIDPTGGLKDLEDRCLRVTSETAYRNDPLRVLRLARISCEYGLEPERQSVISAGRHCDGLEKVSGERIFYELRKLLTMDEALAGIELMDQVGGLEVILPEFTALKGIGQTPYHHLDAFDHTIEVLRQLVLIEKDSSVYGDFADEVNEKLSGSLADGLSFKQALRFGAIFHDLGKSNTHAVRDDGRVTFMGHDREGRIMTADICRRLKTSSRLSAYLQGLTLHHLRLGFLVHERPLTKRQVYQYINICEPVALEVTVLSVADRLATQGERTKQRVIDDHLELSREMIGQILEWRAQFPRKPLATGGELTEALSIEPGPIVGQLMNILDEAQYAGDIKTKDEALSLARLKYSETTD